MNRNSRAIPIIFSLLAVLMMAMMTHYVVTSVAGVQSGSASPSLSAAAADANSFDSYTGLTPLMQAAIDGDIQRTRFLLEHGAKINTPSANADRDFALNYALINGSELGNIAVAHLLINAGADVNAASARGMTSIHTLMRVTNFDNRVAMLNDLLAHGVNINAQAEDGSTMLHITVTNNDRDWTRHLVQNYSQIINFDIKDNQGRTPMDLAVELGRVSTPLTQSVQDELRRRPRYIGDNFDGRATDKQGRTGLMLAVIRQDEKFVTALLDKTDLAHQDSFGNTALHYAVINPDPTWYVQTLLKAKAPTNIANDGGETPLFFVMRIKAQTLRGQIAKMLIDANSPLTNRNRNGFTIIELAQAAGDKPLQALINQALTQRKQQQATK